MFLPPIASDPAHDSYDVVIIGGASMGSSLAWFLSSNADFDGKILVVERDITFEWCSTAHSNNCMRQQFATPINVEIGLYAAEFVKNFRENLGGDREVPALSIRNFGYLYLAGDDELADVLIRDQKTQADNGAGTRIVQTDEIAKNYPFYHLDDIKLGSLNTRDEGYFDALAMVQWWRRKARENGVDYIANEVVAIGRNGDRVDSVTLSSGKTIKAGIVVNAAGTHAKPVCALAGIEVPIEPRRRYTFIFRPEKRLDRDLPLTIDPTGVHMRTYGDDYLIGCPPIGADEGVDANDFGYEDGIWEQKIHPVLAHRVPAFEKVEVITSWVGHYAFNTFDQNAIIGSHSEVGNFILMNGFSGHGTQQAPAMGRGVAELITYDGYRSLDLSPFAFDRLQRNEPLVERAVI